MRRSNIRAWYRLAACVTPLLGVAACAELSSPRQSTLSTAALTGAFSTVPVGFGEISTSFVGTSAASVPSAASGWVAVVGASRPRVAHGRWTRRELQRRRRRIRTRVRQPRPVRRRTPVHPALQHLHGSGDLRRETRNGLTINRSAQYKDASGAVQQAFDSTTTNSVNTQASVTGTVTYTPDSRI